jgi:hypothetical protein
MRSSISSSEYRRATAVLLAGCIAIGLTVEGAARVGFHLASKIQRRFVTEYQRAETFGTRDDRKHVLLVGNSLMLEGVAFDRLKAALAERQWDARRLVLERTFYYDWYFGLKHLLESGSRPDVVVLMLSTRQMVSPEIRGEFSAHYLMGASDVLELSREQSWHPTKLTNMMFAHVSRFWAARAELRNFCLTFLVPDMNGLVDLFTSTPNAKGLPAEEVEPEVRARVARIQQLLDQHGARLVLLVPPLLSSRGSNDGEGGGSALIDAAHSLGVPALKPFEATTFGRDSFRDAGFHLNSRGAAHYTQLLAPVLGDTLSAMPVRELTATHPVIEAVVRTTN